LPHTLNGWVQLHPDVIYRMLFHGAWQRLKRFAENPKRLGGQLGMSAVLHTWGQTLIQHVHLHCLVPGGVLNDKGQWKAAKGNYLFPVKALSRHFRGTLVSALRQRAETGELSRVTHPGDIDRTLDELMAQDPVCYCVTRTTVTMTETRRCIWPVLSLSAGICCMYCPKCLPGSVTMGFWRAVTVNSV
jgi:hypothetical protein